jgi:glycosyltransferase involved in cell wall biosynthesis
MRIALLFHGVLPVKGYGGTERVVVWLARGLAELGHEVTLIAGPGSRVPEAKLVPVPPKIAERSDFDVRPLLPRGLDVLHAHRALGPADVPTVWTLHGNDDPKKSRPPNLICLSADHARRHGTVAYVHNGLDPAEHQLSAKSDFDLFLGRLHTVKGWRWAVEGAAKANRPLVIAGGWRPSIRRDLRFAGTVDGAEKQALLSGARCLWMPALWDEPFGLTLIEALASGTPVLGTRRGALPEVVSSDVGALGTTVDELVALRPSLDQIAPEACRGRVEAHFTHRAMAAGYLRYYQAAMAGSPLPPGHGPSSQAETNLAQP